MHCFNFETRVITKTKQLGKSHEFCGGRHCFSYCSWPPGQQNSRVLIGLNCILLCLNNSSQIAKKHVLYPNSVCRLLCNSGYSKTRLDLESSSPPFDKHQRCKNAEATYYFLILSFFYGIVQMKCFQALFSNKPSERTLYKCNVIVVC